MISPTITREIGTPIILSGIPYNVHSYSGVKEGAPIIVPHYGAGEIVEERVGGTPIVLNDRARGYMGSGSTKQAIPARAGRSREFDSSERVVPAGGISFDSYGPGTPPRRVKFDSSRPAPPPIQ
ncbi:uncharacterized protein LAJ45_06877 [Morchella importuna]|uniref:Uncharacterized protein n=1 Tax=Morchella conica CCBAS932 TaxID=1392247 RepID=A0A3N4KCQ7_9PEZI|nr:uncharacterized protein LAJ45_06877 [Morchella importuna]KAH8148903.1 hypothetical protein LAJ45_06877 [Morchella importuna]RPB07129.1 hypothetical protein P167DRAFT_434265 [Morchella conica CCBAS932]